MLYIFAIIKRNHFEVIMCVCFSHDTKHVYFEVNIFLAHKLHHIKYICDSSAVVSYGRYIYLIILSKSLVKVIVLIFGSELVCAIFSNAWFPRKVTSPPPNFFPSIHEDHLFGRYLEQTPHVPNGLGYKVVKSYL